MKATKIFQIGWRILFASIFAVSFLQTTPVHAANVDLQVTKVLNGATTFTQAENDRTYTITVKNEGADPSSGLVTVTDTLPAGLTAIAIIGTGWSCTLGNPTSTCTRSDSLAGGGAAYLNITLTVDVAVDAAATEPDPHTLINTVNVSGGGDTDPTGDKFQLPTNVTQKPDLLITGYELRNEANDTVITTVNPDEAFHIRMTIKNRGGAESGLFYPGVFLDDKPHYGIDHSPLGEVTDFSNFLITPPSNPVVGGGCLYYDPPPTVDPSLVTEANLERGNYTRLDFNPSLPPGAEVDVDVYIGYPDIPEYSDPVYDSIRTGLPIGSYKIILYVDPNCSSLEESFEDNNRYPLDTNTTINLSIGVSPCTIPSGNPPVFGDVPDGYWAKDYIEAMYYCGYTGGCSTTPLLFCPEKIMNRAESAVFLLRGIVGTSYTPPAPPWTTFQDDFSPGTWAQGWVQGFYNEGMTAGCTTTGPFLYCAWRETSRAELAVFALRLKYGSAYAPPPATGTVFADVHSEWFASWAEQAYLDGLIDSCGTQGGLPMFCPNSLVSRALASVSIVKAKGLLP